MKRIIAGFGILGFSLWAGMAGATDYTWTGDGDGTTWANADNWGGSGFPSGAGDTALINTGSALITTSGNLILGALTLDTGFTGTNRLGGSLTLSTAGGGSGTLTVNAGTLQTVKDAVGGISVAGAMTIGSAGKVVVRRSSTTGDGAGQTITAQSLVVDGSLNANGQGFNHGEGPSPGSGLSRGGSHGGRGQSTVTSGLVEGTPYGSVTHPTALGSGGRSGSGYEGCVGGGAIDVEVANGITISGTGTISARGGNENEFGPGNRMGAGGSVNIRAATLSGTGTILANGGVGTHRSGGGGRIAVELTLGTDFGSVQFQAFGGGSFATAGTVYRKHAGHTGKGEVIIDNNNNDLETRNGYTDLSAGGDVVDDYARVVITNNGNLAIRSIDTLNLSTATIIGTGPATSALTLLGTNGVTFPSPFTLPTSYALRIDVPVNESSSDWTIPSGAVLSHSPNYNTEAVRLQLALRNLTIQSGGEINADGKGYIAFEGQGVGSASSASSHGGGGGNSSAIKTYGSVTQPTSLGSGGGQTTWNTPGGGAVILTISDALINNGLISANSTATGSSRRGSGGSVNITAGTVSGSGTNRANGAISGNYGGGGGRVAARLTTGDDFGSVTFQALGGPGNNFNGAAGTIFKQIAGDGIGAGAVLVSNNNVTAQGIGAVTPLPPFAASTEDLERTRWTAGSKGTITLVADAAVDTLALQAEGYLELAGFILTLHGLTIDDQTFAAGSYAASALGARVTDSSVEQTGRVVIVNVDRGTIIMIR